MRLALLGMLALSFLKGCDISGGPEVISQKFQTSLQPYFPNARTEVLPSQQVIMGYTCAQGVGPGLVEQVGEFLQNDPNVLQLKQLRSLGPILGSPTYRYVGLAFDKQLIRLNVDSWEVEELNLPQGYVRAYRQVCGLPTTEETGVYVWVAHFTVILSKPFNGRTEIGVFDTLGLYGSDEDFAAGRDRELPIREKFIRQDCADRQMEVSSIRLDFVEKVSVPRSLLARAQD